MFRDSKVNITTEGKRHLEAAISSNEFRVKYVTEKVNEWTKKELKTLSNFPKSQPQIAHVALCFGQHSKYGYFLRTIPSISKLMKAVDEIIQNDLLPLIFEESVAENERQLYSFPARSRGLGIPVFSEKAENDFDNSLCITAPLVALIIITQDETLPKNKIVIERIETIK